MALRIGLAQINSYLGDFKYNTDKICDFIHKARALECDLISFPELSITGYPPEDLIYKSDFIKANQDSLKLIKQSCARLGAIVGFIEKEKGRFFNSAAFIYDKKIVGIYRKIHLPNYGVFDEKRYFSTGEDFKIYDLCGIRIGIDICEDIWVEKGPVTSQARAGAQLIFAINASPYHIGKLDMRKATLKEQATANKVFIAYTNAVGGQDELVFDGRNLLVNPKGKILAQGKPFEEELVVYDIGTKELPKKKVNPKKLVKVTVKGPVCSVDKKPIISVQKEKLSAVEEVYRALSLGLKDYTTKNGFRKVVIGLSGGIDSSLVAALAVDVIGKENVVCVFMPTQFSSDESREDTEQLAHNLGIDLWVIPIQDLFSKYLDGLKGYFKDTLWGTAEENLQARIRGNILMALSNKFGWLVLTTGNKSEVSVGYMTLYGDSAGGFSAIKDVPKTLVYKLAQYRNSLAEKPVIPERVLTKPPTAELKENQRDTDSLPPYDVLDPILKAYIEDNKPIAKIIALGFDKDTVKRTISMVDKNEYKRRQSPPGIKVSSKAFGRDRRMPITNRFKQD